MFSSVINYACSKPLESRAMFLYGVLLLFRVCNALFVRTYFNPDEYWQSIEIAHKLVFGYGYETWEWNEESQLRGYAHPMIFAVLYKALQITNLDSRWMIAYSPRILQGCFAAICDIYTYKFALKYFKSESVARWTLFAQIFSWFNFYCLVRTFSSSLETSLTVVALYYWPWQIQHMKRDGKVSSIERSDTALALGFAALSTIIRPTSAILWFILGCQLVFFQMKTHRERMTLILYQVLPIGLCAIAAMVALDRIGYGAWTFVPLNFIRFNLLQGKGKLYGEHPWHWYFSEGFPAIVAVYIPASLYGIFKANNKHHTSAAYGVLVVLCVLSFSVHKEFRFVLPLLPIMLTYAGFGLHTVYLQGTRGSTSSPTSSSTSSSTSTLKALRVFILFAVVSNSIAAVYLSRWHQAAPLAVMDHLSHELELLDMPKKKKDDDDVVLSVHFLLSCHATPYYSHVHSAIKMYFPTCTPSERENPPTPSDRVMDSPMEFVGELYQTEALPTFIVAFSSTARRLQVFFDKHGYTLQKTFFHAHLSGDRDDDNAQGEIQVFRAPWLNL